MAEVQTVSIVFGDVDYEERKLLAVYADNTRANKFLLECQLLKSKCYSILSIQDELLIADQLNLVEVKDYLITGEICLSIFDNFKIVEKEVIN